MATRTTKPPKPTANGAVTTSEVLTLAEAAAFLRVPEAAVLELASAGQLPARKIGNAWRFLKEAIVDWLRLPQLAAELKKKSMLAVIGAFKDDETLEPMVEAIYRQRKQNPVEG